MPNPISKPDKRLTAIDELGMSERFQRGLQRAFQTPHKPITLKPKERPARKGCRIHGDKIKN